jgi:hypothetical protein
MHPRYFKYRPAASISLPMPGVRPMKQSIIQAQDNV